MTVTVNYLGRIETEKSWSGYKTKRTTGDVDKTYDLATLLPSFW